MKDIPLTRGKSTIVDDADFEFLSQWRWSCTNHGYAVRSKDSVRMNRLLLNASKTQQVDHRNGDKLDNRRENLRICTVAQNMMNSKPKRNSISGLKGVSPDVRGRWRATIQVEGKTLILGRFLTKQGAALAYKVMSLLVYGEFAFAARGSDASVSA